MKSFSNAISMAADKHRVYIAVLFIQLVYAGMALFSKAAIAKGMNPFVFVVYRQAFATLALAPLAYFFESSKEVPLSYTILIKIFFISLFGITLSLNLYYVAINYTSATFAAATTTTIPAITFVMAVLLRMESISIKHLHGVAKVLGSVTSLSGALVYALIKGPPLKFMNLFPENEDHQIHPQSSYRGEWIKGSLIMLSANTAWSLWLILQAPIVKQYPAKLRLTGLQCFFSCMQSAFLTIAIERRPSAWKIGWDIHLLAVAYCGVIVTGITYWLQVWAIEKRGAVFTAMFTPLALFITAVCSTILWKQGIYWGRYEICCTYSGIAGTALFVFVNELIFCSIGGGVLLVAGLYCVLWGKKKESQQSKEDYQKQEQKGEVLIVCDAGASAGAATDTNDTTAVPEIEAPIAAEAVEAGTGRPPPEDLEAAARGPGPAAGGRDRAEKRRTQLPTRFRDFSLD